MRRTWGYRYRGAAISTVIKRKPYAGTKEKRMRREIGYTELDSSACPSISLTLWLEQEMWLYGCAVKWLG
jgi:hypothetical protein